MAQNMNNTHAAILTVMFLVVFTLTPFVFFVYSGVEKEIVIEAGKTVKITEYSLKKAVTPNVFPDPMRGFSWVVSSISLVLVLFAVGCIFKRKLLGIAIDRRNRYSLSRLQIMLWTVLVIPTIYIQMLFNTLRAWGTPIEPSMFAIDWNLLALMGISIGSFVTAPMALSVKARSETAASETAIAVSAADKVEAPAGATQTPSSTISTEGRLLVRKDPAKANLLVDLFRGEEIGTAGNIDIARIQMLVITLVVWVVYVIRTADVMFFNSTINGQLTGIPGLEIDSSLLALILISHGGYIAGKVVPNGGQPKDRLARDLSGLNSIELKATSLIREIDDYLRFDLKRGADDGLPLRLKADSAKLIKDARALNTRVAANEAVSEDIALLEGRLSGLTSTFHTIRLTNASGEPDIPAASLVQEVRGYLDDRKLYGAVVPSSVNWTSEDTEALDAYLDDQGVPRDSLGHDLTENLRLIRELIR